MYLVTNIRTRTIYSGNFQKNRVYAERIFVLYLQLMLWETKETPKHTRDTVGRL